MGQRHLGLIVTLVILGIALAGGGYWYFTTSVVSPTQTASPPSHSPAPHTQVAALPSSTSTSAHSMAPVNASSIPEHMPTSTTEAVSDTAVFETTTTIDNAFFEIKNDSLFVDGTTTIASIPLSLGMTPADYVVGLSDLTQHQAVYYFPSVPKSNPSVIDYYSNIIPSIQHNRVAVIYFRDLASASAYASDGNNPDNQPTYPYLTAATTTVSKLLIFDLNGALLSATDLRGTPPGNASGTPYGPYRVDGLGMNLLELGNSSVYIDEDRGSDVGYDVIRSANLSDGIVRDTIDNGIAINNNPFYPSSLGSDPYAGAFLSPSGRYFAYDGVEGFGASSTEYSADSNREAPGINNNCSVAGAQFSMSDLEILDFQTGSSTLITFDLTKAFSPVAWSKDDSTVLILIGVGDTKGCYSHTTNFMTYNVTTNRSVVNQNLADVQRALTSVCSEGDFNCSGESRWFDLSDWH